MWVAGAGGVAAIVVILTLAFDRSKKARQLGEALERIDNLATGNDWLRAALRNQSSADPTLDDLDRMFDDTDTEATG